MQSLTKFILLKKKFKYREILGELVSGIVFMLIQFSFFQNFITKRNDFTDNSFFIYIVFSFIISSACSISLIREFCISYHKNTLYKKYLSTRNCFFHIIKYYFLEKMLSFLFFSFIFLTLCLFLGLISIDLLNSLPVFLFTTSLAFLLDIFLRIILACILMRNRNYQSLLKAYNQIARILSGAIVPLSFFPLILRSVIFYLPFYYLVFFPLDVLLHGANLKALLIQVVLVFLFFIISFFIFNLNLKNLKQRGDL